MEKDAVIRVSFKIDSEDEAFIMNNLVKVVEERLARWPLDVDEIRIETELN